MLDTACINMFKAITLLQLLCHSPLVCFVFIYKPPVKWQTEGEEKST